MSRSGYGDDCENVAMWRGAVLSAIKGKRGQTFLRELLESLDALPVKALAANSFTKEGVCALGSVALKRGLDVSGLEPGEYGDVDRDAVANVFGIAPAMAAEIMFENDGDFSYSRRDQTPEQRFEHVRTWVLSQIKQVQQDVL
jgi:hypothetical protein